MMTWTSRCVLDVCIEERLKGQMKGCNVALWWHTSELMWMNLATPSYFLWAGIPVSWPFALLYISFTNNSICVSVLHSTFVPGKNGDDQLRVLETWSSAQMLSTMIYGLMHKQGCTSIFMRWIIRLFLCFIIKEMNNFMQQIWQTSRARKMCQNLQYKINILFRIISCTFIKTNLIV